MGYVYNIYVLHCMESIGHVEMLRLVLGTYES